MARAKGMGNFPVILGALILVPHDHGNGSTGGFSLENSGKNLHLVPFLPLGHLQILPRTAPFQHFLNILFRQGKPCRAAVYNHPQGLTVGFSEGTDMKYFSVLTSRHSLPPTLYHTDAVWFIHFQLSCTHG